MRNKVFLSIVTAFMLWCLSACSSQESDALLLDGAEGSMIADASASLQGAETEPLDSDGDGACLESSVTADTDPKTIAVFICGAVERPGVYELLEDSRAGDAVEAAGGFSENADQNYVNLAAKLSDGIKLMIPTMEEASDTALVSKIESFDQSCEVLSDGNTGSGVININTASVEQLKTLPGIGDAVAGKIIKYREENGAFKAKEDIMNVSGIKDKLFSKIKDQITV